jgi:hypothetical protein
MSIQDELKRLGFEFDHEVSGGPWQHMDIYVNRRTGMGIAIEWFRLPEVRA